MVRNFTIPYSIAIAFNGAEYDLHNNFTAAKMEFDFEKKSLHVRFEPWGEPEDRQPVNLIFEKIDSLFISPEILSIEELFLEELGFKSPDDVDYDWLTSEAKSTPLDHFVIALSECRYIRVSCKSIVASLGQ
ncbi:hypothetical protein [Pseudomonas sp. nanlin1]|uniref:hypothetical protein n=1 Tax=Pseudomonas sp. nanlin1 TaxID=3040605 RepID=UPI00389029B8